MKKTPLSSEFKSGTGIAFCQVCFHSASFEIIPRRIILVWLPPCCNPRPELYQECVQNSRLSALDSPPVAVTWSSEDLREAPRAPSVPGKTPHPCCEDISWHTYPQRRLHVEPMIHLPLKTFRANLIRPYNTVYLLSHSTHIPTQKCSNTDATQLPTSSDP